jgi:homoserine kinase type II
MDRINDVVVVGEGEVRAALRDYDIPEIVGVRLCENGIINTNYVVGTRGGNYLLRVYNEQRDLDGIEFEVSVLSHLSGCGFRVQRPVADRGGSLIGRLRDRRFALLTFIEGEVLAREAIDARVCEQIGTALADMQTLLDGFTPAGRKPDADYPLICELAELNIGRLRALGPAAAAGVEADWRDVEPLFRDCPFPRGVVHADIYYQNVIVRDGELVGIIDFDDAYFGVLLYDLALVVMEFAIKEEGKMDFSLAEPVLRSYLAKRPLPREQAGALYDAMRFLCFKFLGYTAELAEFRGAGLLKNGYVTRLAMFRNPEVRARFEALLATLLPH